MPLKASEMPDEEIKELMRAISRANGRPLTEERVAADLPAYKNFLLAIERIDGYQFAVEDEPAFHFSLELCARVPKEGSR
jgi:hypothetical protein